VFTWRQLVPPVFVLALIASALSALAWPRTAPGLALIVAAYLVAVAASALPLAARHGIRVPLAFCAPIPVLPLSSGSGCLTGDPDVLVLRRNSVRGAPAAVPTSR
jgi:hypothetical protein